MSDSGSQHAGASRRSVSSLDKFNAAALLAVTPEYRVVKRAQGKNYGSTPTFSRPASMPLKSKNVAGVDVRYEHAGSAHNPTVILLNPLPQSIIAFAPLWEKLAMKFNLYAYELSGFGGSAGGSEHMTFEAQGRFLRDFIAEFDIRNPHLLGPDIGMPRVADSGSEYFGEQRSQRSEHRRLQDLTDHHGDEEHKDRTSSDHRIERRRVDDNSDCAGSDDRAAPQPVGQGRERRIGHHRVDPHDQQDGRGLFVGSGAAIRLAGPGIGRGTQY